MTDYKPSTEADLARAVALREAAKIAHHWHDRDELFMPRVDWEKDTEDRIRSLLTQSSADALAIYVAEAVLAESEWWAIRGNVLDVNGECCKRLLANRAKVKGD